MRGALPDVLLASRMTINAGFGEAVIVSDGAAVSVTVTVLVRDGKGIGDDVLVSVGRSVAVMGAVAGTGVRDDVRVKRGRRKLGWTWCIRMKSQPGSRDRSNYTDNRHRNLRDTGPCGLIQFIFSRGRLFLSMFCAGLCCVALPSAAWRDRVGRDPRRVFVLLR